MSTGPGRQVPRPFEMPWGKGNVVEEATSLGQWHQPCIQLLEYDDGSLSVRFCSYTLNGRFQRSPLMIGEQDVAGLRGALPDAPRLHSLLKDLVA